LISSISAQGFSEAVGCEWHDFCGVGIVAQGVSQKLRIVHSEMVDVVGVGD